MLSTRQALGEIRFLLERGIIKKDGIPKEKFSEFLDPEDPYYDQIKGEQSVNQEYARAS